MLIIVVQFGIYPVKGAEWPLGQSIDPYNVIRRPHGILAVEPSYLVVVLIGYRVGIGFPVINYQGLGIR